MQSFNLLMLHCNFDISNCIPMIILCKLLITDCCAMDDPWELGQGQSFNVNLVLAKFSASQISVSHLFCLYSFTGMHCIHNYSTSSSTEHEWRITIRPKLGLYVRLSSVALFTGLHPDFILQLSTAARGQLQDKIWVEDEVWE